MNKYIWRKIVVGVGKEATRWTVASITKWIPKANLDYENKSEKIIDESAIGVIEDSFEWHVAKQRSEWTLEINMYSESIGFLLLSLFGGASTSWANPYTHVFEVENNNQHQSLTLWLADDTQDRRFALAMVESVEINASLQDFVKVSTTFKAKKSADATLTPSFSQETAFISKHVKAKIASDLAWLAWAWFIKVKSVQLQIAKNLEDDDILWSVEPDDFCNTFFAVTGSIELLREDETHLDTYMDGVKQALRIQIADPDVDLWAGVNPSLTFDLAKVILTEFWKVQDNNGLVKQSLTFKGLYSMSDTKMINATLINSTSTY